MSIESETRDDVFVNRFGVGTRPEDVFINWDLKGEDSDAYTLSIQDFSDSLIYTRERCGFDVGKADMHMYTLLGIHFIQSNGAINANNFDNLTFSLCGSRAITYELMMILYLAVEKDRLSPKARWRDILYNCSQDDCRII